MITVAIDQIQKQTQKLTQKLTQKQTNNNKQQAPASTFITVAIGVLVGPIWCRYIRLCPHWFVGRVKVTLGNVDQVFDEGACILPFDSMHLDGSLSVMELIGKRERERERQQQVSGDIKYFTEVKKEQRERHTGQTPRHTDRQTRKTRKTNREQGEIIN